MKAGAQTQPDENRIAICGSTPWLKKGVSAFAFFRHVIPLSGLHVLFSVDI